MRALVTGGAGFIGSWLVERLLAEGHEVQVVDDLSTGTLANLADARAAGRGRLGFHRLDVRAPELGELVGRFRPDVIFHLASRRDGDALTADPVVDAEVELLGALGVLEAARAAATPKVVFASAAAAVGRDATPATAFAVAKRVVDFYLAVYRDLYEVEFTSLALGDVYGPRQDPSRRSGLVGALVGAALDGDGLAGPLDVGSSPARDLVYVDDVVDAFVRAGVRGSGLVLDIGTGVATPLPELATLVAAAAGVDAGPAFALPDGDGARPARALDPSRAGIHLGWKPWTDVATGAAALVRWARTGTR